MPIVACTKCGSVDIFSKLSGSQFGVYCSDCGAWIKWINKDEQRVIERQIEKNRMVPEEEEELICDISQFSDEELLEEIQRRMR